MVAIRRFFARVAHKSPDILVRKAIRRLVTPVSKRWARWQDYRSPTRVTSLRPDDSSELYVILASIAPEADDRLLLNRLAAHYIDHCFDILGSGWTVVRHGMNCRGVEGLRYQSGDEVKPTPDGSWLKGRINPANLADSKAIWALVDPDYQPIDWHLDFKSGHRWAEDCWYRDIKIAPRAGVDIKVPWELARMHHLPQLARACALASSIAVSDQIVREFRNEILDFIATNPPRFGVNWACAMDVGIRVANWLLAYDLFRASGVKFDRSFKSVFSDSIRDHAIHIAGNLEWNDGLRGNHYLADITGLLFASAYLPKSSQVDAWLAFSIQELIKETFVQFHEEGSNFEASTAYHRLSAEMVVYATALVIALPADKLSALNTYEHRALRSYPTLRPGPTPVLTVPGAAVVSPFPEKYWIRLERMAEFTIDLTAPSGDVVQIGDNDSGRLFKLYPTYHEIPVNIACGRFANLEGYHELPDSDIYLLERTRDHRHLVAAINGFFNRHDFTVFSTGHQAETRLVRCFMTISIVGSSGADSAKGRIIASRGPILQSPEVGSGFRRYAASRLREGLGIACYPTFGVFIYRSPTLFLAIRCGQIGLNGLGAHAHNDQLSIELWLHGKPIIVDPGTYLYTALPERRNAYRSAAAHSGPRLEGTEPGSLKIDLFALGNEARAECLAFNLNDFVGRFSAGPNHIYRAVSITDEAIEISDWSTDPGSTPIAAFESRIAFSDAYGWLERATDQSR